MSGKFRTVVLKSSAACFKTLERASITPTARVLLRHNFLFDEPRERSLDRLRRELDWLRQNYNVISVPELVSDLSTGQLRDRSLVYTADDAEVDVYEIHREFQNFEIPLTMYVPVGWVRSSESAESGGLVEAVTLIQWYEGPEVTITLPNSRKIVLSPSSRREIIEWLLTCGPAESDLIAGMCEKVAKLPGSHKQRPAKRPKCSWEELAELAQDGLHISSHSVSHVRMAEATPLRQKFEAQESQRILETKFGPCTTFAYPFGTPDSYDRTTMTSLANAGYSAAFLTMVDVVTPSTPVFELPRIPIPDHPIPIVEFQARVDGGGIIPRRMRAAYGNHHAERPDRMLS